MQRTKAVIIVLLLMALAGGGAIYGLALWSKIQFEALAESRLAEAENLVVDGMRAGAFELIQKLSAETRREDLLTALAKVPPTESLEGDVLLQALKPAQELLQPLVAELLLKMKVPSLCVVGPDG
jgi:type II secretory pathway pseudopilin PulG